MKTWKWKLEVLRMFAYIMFPVGSFYYFNQPGFFEDYIVHMHRVHLPSEEQQEKDIAILKEAGRQRSLNLLQAELKKSEK